MFEIYRRHNQACEKKLAEANYKRANAGRPIVQGGRSYNDCRCTIYLDGTDASGREDRRSLKTRDWQLALTRLGEKERGEEPKIPQPLVMLGKAQKLFLEERERANQPASTMRAYSGIFKHFLLAIGDRSLGNINQEAVKTFVFRKELKSASQKLYLTLLAQFFGWAVKAKKFIAVDPCAGIARPEVKSKQYWPLEHSEVTRLLRAIDEIEDPARRIYCRALVLVLLYSGLRVSDVVRLRRSEIATTGHIWIVHTKKANSPTKILLRAEVLEALKALPNRGEYYFLETTERAQCDRVRNILDTLSAKAGIPHVSPHRLRNTFSCDLLDSGVPILEVSRLLAHKDVATTIRYYNHFRPSGQAALDKAVGKLDYSSSGPSAPLQMYATGH